LSKFIAFLPMRKGSQRVKNKNIKDFANIKGGLTFIKISQLLKSTKIDKIIVSTNDEEVKNIALSFDDSKIMIDDRPEYLASSETSTDDLVKYVPSIIESGVVLWTHVTSPFITESIYDDMIEKYLETSNTNDSLMSVTKIQKFLWNKNGPINYDKSKEKWPRTQTIEPIYEVNSGAFIADVEVYKALSDRVGNKPYLYELSDKEAFDIDWQDDFDIAEVLWSKYGKI
jgi:CMP-N-acetylneuraminic acid synthetase